MTLLKKEHGIEVKSASSTIEEVVAREFVGKQARQRNIKIPSNASFADTKAEDYDALVIPGGRAPEYLRLDEAVLGVVRHFAEARKPIAALCHGPQILLTADMVKGRTMTAWKTVQTDLRVAGANVLDREVVTDRNLVTSRKPEDLEAFVRESLRLLSNGAVISRH